MLDTMIQQLGRELHMKDLIENPEPRHFILPFEDNIKVELKETDFSYLFKGTIGPYPEKNGPAFTQKAMESNLYGRGTRGASVGLSPDGKSLLLSLEIDSSVNYKEFQEKLEDFVSVLDYWRTEAAKMA
ncbi:MAG: type III secretion system chaperone [Parachlamydia sp.]|jgi:hypothetical protein|nr:type III secretion system chaperone [Parachlamydia sp.]